MSVGARLAGAVRLLGGSSLTVEETSHIEVRPPIRFQCCVDERVRRHDAGGVARADDDWQQERAEQERCAAEQRQRELDADQARQRAGRGRMAEAAGGREAASSRRAPVIWGVVIPAGARIRTMSQFRRNRSGFDRPQRNRPILLARQLAAKSAKSAGFPEIRSASPDAVALFEHARSLFDAPPVAADRNASDAESTAGTTGAGLRMEAIRPTNVHRCAGPKQLRICFRSVSDFTFPIS